MEGGLRGFVMLPVTNKGHKEELELVIIEIIVQFSLRVKAKAALGNLVVSSLGCFQQN